MRVQRGVSKGKVFNFGECQFAPDLSCCQWGFNINENALESRARVETTNENIVFGLSAPLFMPTKYLAFAHLRIDDDLFI